MANTFGDLADGVVEGFLGFLRVQSVTGFVTKRAGDRVETGLRITSEGRERKCLWAQVDRALVMIEVPTFIRTRVTDTNMRQRACIHGISHDLPKVGRACDRVLHVLSLIRGKFVRQLLQIRGDASHGRPRRQCGMI
jgi:hypothetical protein